MWKNVLIVIIFSVIVLSVIVATQPDDFRITRSATIPAPVAVVFEHVNNFHNWELWSPWAKLDPNIINTFEGAEAGVGAILRWKGNDKVGVGSNTIIESKPNELIKIKLEFLKPFEATSTAEFTFKPEGDQTVATWSMYGKNNFIGKAMGLVMNCDKMVGAEFEKGLANLRAVVAR